jgi:platelet-activating factor acetylhydrolase
MEPALRRENTTRHGTAHHLPVRLLYPTLEKVGLSGGIPYFNPDIAVPLCEHSMKFGAPPPLKNFGWILHTWRLTSLPAKRNAPLLPSEEPLAVVVFSHGLGGTLDMYSYQTMSLAAEGNVVLSLNHLDGSAPVVPQPANSGDQDVPGIEYDYDIVDLWKQGKEVEYVRERRARTDQRVMEFIVATEALHQLNDGWEEISDDAHFKSHLERQMAGLSLKNRLQLNHTFFMGHSFGGSTALTAAKRRPDLVKGIIAHEPAADWMPDDARTSLFPRKLLEKIGHSFDGGTGGFEKAEDETNSDDNSIHDVRMLVLNSEEWATKQWGGAHLMEAMHERGMFGSLESGPSFYDVIKSSRHNDFADTSMLTPVWLARAVGITGPRTPSETAFEIAERTLSFVQDTLRT